MFCVRVIYLTVALFTIGHELPQGSIYFRFFALCFIPYNDLPIVVKYSSLDLYADDGELHCSHSDLSKDMSVCMIWMLWLCV